MTVTDAQVEAALDAWYGDLQWRKWSQLIQADARTFMRRALEAAEAAAWRPASEAPEGVWLDTWLEGEKGTTMSKWVKAAYGHKEWIEFGSGRTTITHSSYAAPSHYRPLATPPAKG